MMMTSFELYALVILAPFPFFRRFLTTASPYFIRCFTAFATVLLLTSLGFLRGEIKMPADTAGSERERIIRFVTSAVAGLVMAARVYAGVAALETVVNKEANRRE